MDYLDIFNVGEALDIFTKGKSLKKIKIKIDNFDTWVSILGDLVEKIKESKKIEYEVIFEQFDNDKELSLDYGNYYFKLIVINDSKLSNY